MLHLFNKILHTTREMQKTAYHHYGENPLSIIKFIYYGLFRINTFIIFLNDLEKDIKNLDLDNEYDVIIPTMADLDNIRAGKILPREFYYDKIHNVITCFIVLRKKEIAYIHWVYFQGDYSRFLRIQPKTAEINYATTLPKFRGNKLSAIMFAYTSNYLKNLGYKKAIVVANENNPAVIKTFLMAGFKEIKRVKSIGPFNRKLSI